MKYSSFTYQLLKNLFSEQIIIKILYVSVSIFRKCMKIIVSVEFSDIRHIETDNAIELEGNGTVGRGGE